MIKITNLNMTKAELASRGYLRDMGPDDEIICKTSKYVPFKGSRSIDLGANGTARVVTFTESWFVEDDYIISKDGKCKLLLGKKVHPYEEQFIILFQMGRFKKGDTFRKI